MSTGLSATIMATQFGVIVFLALRLRNTRRERDNLDRAAEAFWSVGCEIERMLPNFYFSLDPRLEDARKERSTA